MRIGIPLSMSKTQYFVNQAYIRYLIEAKFTPVVIAPGIPAETYINDIDGLMLPGGIDVDPIYYGEDNIRSYSTDAEKDAFERELFHTVRMTGKPIFGICRGFQLIIKEYLIADPEMEEYLTFFVHIGGHNQTGDLSLERTAKFHFVDFQPSMLYGERSKKESSGAVNSMHHQCLVADFRRKGILGLRGFRMAAWTDRGLEIKKNKNHFPLVCEAFRVLKWGSPILAVQWHPEELRDYDLIRNFFLGKAEAELVGEAV